MATCAHCGSNRQSTGACPNCGSFASQSVNVTIVHQNPPRSWWERNDRWAGPALFSALFLLIILGFFGWMWSTQFHQVVVIEKDGMECRPIDYPCKVFVIDEDSGGSERVWYVTDSKVFKSVKPDQRQRVNDKFLRIPTWEDKARLEEIRENVKFLEQLWPEERILEGIILSPEDILKEIAP